MKKNYINIVGNGNIAIQDVIINLDNPDKIKKLIDEIFSKKKPDRIKVLILKKSYDISKNPDFFNRNDVINYLTKINNSYKNQLLELKENITVEPEIKKSELLKLESNIDFCDKRLVDLKTELTVKELNKLFVKPIWKRFWFIWLFILLLISIISYTYNEPILLSPSINSYNELKISILTINSRKYKILICSLKQDENYIVCQSRISYNMFSQSVYNSGFSTGKYIVLLIHSSDSMYFPIDFYLPKLPKYRILSMKCFETNNSVITLKNCN